MIKGACLNTVSVLMILGTLHVCAREGFCLLYCPLFPKHPGGGDTELVEGGPCAGCPTVTWLIHL